MLKLLTANAVQVLRNKAFWACLAFTAVGTAVLVVSTFNMLDYNGLVNRWTAEASLFCMLPGIGITSPSAPTTTKAPSAASWPAATRAPPSMLPTLLPVRLLRFACSQPA